MTTRTFTTEMSGTAATAVEFAYLPVVATGAFPMWSSPTTKHSNKRFAGRPRGNLIT